MSRGCVPLLSRVEQRQRLPFLVCFGVLGIWSTFSNVLVLYLFKRYKSLRISLNKFLVSLAIGDMLLGTVLAPISMLQLMQEESVPACTLEIVAKYSTTLMAISGVTIGCIAYDRYHMVTSVSSKYNQKMSNKMTTLLILLPWFSPLILIASKFAGRKTNAFVVLTLTFATYTILLFSYISIMRLIKTKVFPRTTQLETNQQADTIVDETVIDKHRQREKKKNLVNFLGWLLFWAFICSVPLVVNRVWQLLYLYSNNKWNFYLENEPLLTAFSRVMFVLNGSINPAIYFYVHSGFRKAFVKTFLSPPDNKVKCCLKTRPSKCQQNDVAQSS